MLKTTSFSTNVAIENSNFLASEAKLAILQMREEFTKALILHHFHPERYIWIKIDAFGYTIGGILS